MFFHMILIYVSLSKRRCSNNFPKHLKIATKSVEVDSLEFSLKQVKQIKNKFTFFNTINSTFTIVGLILWILKYFLLYKHYTIIIFNLPSQIIQLLHYYFVNGTGCYDIWVWAIYLFILLQLLLFSTMIFDGVHLINNK